jgi:hypothetical protein
LRIFGMGHLQRRVVCRVRHQSDIYLNNNIIRVPESIHLSSQR